MLDKNLKWRQEYVVWIASYYLIEYSFKSNLYECYFKDNLFDKKETLEDAQRLCQEHCNKEV